MIAWLSSSPRERITLLRMSMRWVKFNTVIALGLLCAVLGGCGGSGPTGAVIRVTPAVGLYDQSRTIVASHLHPGEIVEVAASSALRLGLAQCGCRQSGDVWSAGATFRANRHGVVDLARDAPLSGSYSGVSPMGLFWSEHGTSRRSAPVNGMTVTTLAVKAGSRRLASTRVEQVLKGPGVTQHNERVADVGFFGEYFTPPGLRRHSAVVVWGGSEGGLSTASEAALLASHGIPALALAYFDEPGLPCSLSKIPLEYFVRAIRWLRSQPQVDPRRVWEMSGSRGSEAALLVASHWGDLVHGVVTYAPSSEVYSSFGGNCPPRSAAAWTLHGRPLPYARTVEADLVYHADGSVSDMPAFRAGLADTSATRAARVPVWRIKGPVLLISGGDDQLWPSNTYAARIMASLRSDPSPHLHLNFAGAGHVALGIPYAPTATEYTYRRQLIALGGTPAADNAAYQRDWPATIKFITTH